MKWLGRVLVFGACFLSGLTVALVFGSVGRWISTPTPSPIYRSIDETVDTSPTGLRITYVGWRPGDIRRSGRIKVAVYNGLRQPVYYKSHLPETPSPTVRINGKEIGRIYGCGTGIQTFHILPGQTTEFEVDSFYFTRTPRPGDEINVGFYFKPLISNEYEIHYSEPFVLPEEFRQLIIDRRGDLNL